MSERVKIYMMDWPPRGMSVPTKFVKWSDYDALAAELAAVKARCEQLEERLEINHAFDQDGNRIDIPPHKRDAFPDGIECRDETIRGLDSMVDELAAQRDHWKAEAVWLAEQLSAERVSQWADVYDVTMADEQVQRQVKDDPCYQRAQAVLKEAGDE